MTVGPIHKIVDSVKDGTIAVHCEGYLKNTDYGGAFSEKELEAVENMIGFSAGKFLARGREMLQKLFLTIQMLEKGWTGKPLYTVEQPFFNRAIYSLQEELVNLDLLTEKNVCKDGVDLDTENTVLVDFAGVPGDGDFHFKKILDLFVLYYADLI
jgi:hypothetical protein